MGGWLRAVHMRSRFYRCVITAFSAGMLWFEQESSRPNVLNSRRLNSATKVFVTASVTASFLHGSHVVIHHSAQEISCCAFRDIENVQDTDNTSVVYYFYLASLDGVLPNLCTLHGCPVSLLDDLVVSAHVKCWSFHDLSILWTTLLFWRALCCVRSYAGFVYLKMGYLNLCFSKTGWSESKEYLSSSGWLLNIPSKWYKLWIANLCIYINHAHAKKNPPTQIENQPSHPQKIKKGYFFNPLNTFLMRI